LKLNIKRTTAIVRINRTIPPIGPGLTFVGSRIVDDGNGSGEFPEIEVINLNIYAPLSP
jgi:hypothetical protein